MSSARHPQSSAGHVDRIIPAEREGPKSFAATEHSDRAITADREESKYLVSPEQVHGLIAALQHHLVAHRFTGEGANRLPDARHYVTTVYFDTPSSHYYQTAKADAEHNVKIRAKEYYDVHPALAEVARDPAELVRYQPWVWVELKRRVRLRTSKHRFALPKADVPSFFANGRVTPEAIALSSQIGGDMRDEATATGFFDVVDYLSALEEPLAAVALVNYRRLAWQSPAADLRITLDLDLAYFVPPSDIWSRKTALIRESLGRPCGQHRNLVLELKRTRPLPGWLQESLAHAAAVPQSFSKFVAARRAVFPGG